MEQFFVDGDRAVEIQQILRIGNPVKIENVLGRALRLEAFFLVSNFLRSFGFKKEYLFEVFSKWLPLNARVFLSSFYKMRLFIFPFFIKDVNFLHYFCFKLF